VQCFFLSANDNLVGDSVNIQPAVAHVITTQQSDQSSMLITHIMTKQKAEPNFTA